MTCGTLLEFCNEDFPIPPRLPPPPPILSYYFEDNQLNSSFYCEFCSNLEASLDPLHKQYGDGSGGTGGLFSPYSQNLMFILFVVALMSAAVGSAVTVVWRKWFRCRDGGILSKAFGGSHSPHSADISASPEGRRRSRTASLGSGSALQNLQKRLSSSSFISRRSVYQHHPSNIISTHHRSGGPNISNNTYCECPSNMMMVMCSPSAGGVDGGNNMNASGASTSTTTSLSPCVTAMNINPSAPTASTLSISGGNVYAELDPVSNQQLHSHHPPLPPFPPPGDHIHPIVGMMPVIISPSNSNSTVSPLAIIGNTPGSNQYVLNHRRRQPAPLPPIPTTLSNEPLYLDQSIPLNNALNLNNSTFSINGSSIPSSNKSTIGVHHPNGQMIAGVIPSVQNGIGEENINQMEMNDLNDIYYSDLDCKQIQF